MTLTSSSYISQTKNSAALMRVLHYPPQTGPVDDRVAGIGAHTEYILPFSSLLLSLTIATLLFSWEVRVIPAHGDDDVNHIGTRGRSSALPYSGKSQAFRHYRCSTRRNSGSTPRRSREH